MLEVLGFSPGLYYDHGGVSDIFLSELKKEAEACQKAYYSH